MVNPSKIQPEDLKLSCSTCEKDLCKVNHYMCCDVTMGEYCDDCWSNTVCAKGEHDEGCKTQVFITYG